MKYTSIRNMDISNGEGIRVSLFVSGCKFHCPDCFNQEAQSFDYGKPYTFDTEQKILELVSNPYVAGLSILGGDPLWQSKEDIEQLCHLTSEVRRRNKTVWLWSGFTWEETVVNQPQLKSFGVTNEEELVYNRFCLVTASDVFVDGRYEKDLKDLTLKWRGSSNQRVIDVRKSIAAKQVILYGENN